MGDAEPVELRDRAEDRRGAVIDIVGKADSRKPGELQRLAADGGVGEKTFLFDTMRSGRMIEQTFEIAENRVRFGKSLADPCERRGRIGDVHQVDVADQDQGRRHAGLFWFRPRRLPPARSRHEYRSPYRQATSCPLSP